MAAARDCCRNAPCARRQPQTRAARTPPHLRPHRQPCAPARDRRVGRRAKVVRRAPRRGRKQKCRHEAPAVEPHALVWRPGRPVAACARCNGTCPDERYNGSTWGGADMARPARGDRVALVTGAASGIGLATARRLFESGWKVAAVDRDADALARLAGELGTPSRVFTAPLDVTDEPAAEKVVAMAGEALGRLDGVVNSAGIAADIHALETPVDLFRKVLDVNVVGTFIVARAAARVMRNTGGGAIVNISSISGVRGSKGRSAYGASKGAVVVLTQVLA